MKSFGGRCGVRTHDPLIKSYKGYCYPIVFIEFISPKLVMCIFCVISLSSNKKCFIHFFNTIDDSEHSFRDNP